MRKEETTCVLLYPTSLFSLPFVKHIEYFLIMPSEKMFVQSRTTLCLYASMMRSNIFLFTYKKEKKKKVKEAKIKTRKQKYQCAFLLRYAIKWIRRADIATNACFSICIPILYEPEFVWYILFFFMIWLVLYLQFSVRL